MRVPSRIRTCDLDVRSVARCPTAPWGRESRRVESNHRPSPYQSDALNLLSYDEMKRRVQGSNLRRPASPVDGLASRSLTTRPTLPRADDGNRTRGPPLDRRMLYH